MEIGEREFRFECIPVNQSIPELRVQAINLQTGAPLKNVFFELWKDQTSSPEEGLSDEQGLFVFKVRQVDIITIVARKSGFVPISKNINFTKGFILNTEDHLVMVPMVKEEPHDANNAYGILTFNGHVSHV